MCTFKYRHRILSVKWNTRTSVYALFHQLSQFPRFISSEFIQMKNYGKAALKRVYPSFRLAYYLNYLEGGLHEAHLSQTNLSSPMTKLQVHVVMMCVCSATAKKPDDGLEEMIGCDNVECSIEWFHMKCLKLKRVPKGKWYCPDCRKFSRHKKIKSLL